jgi:hypothetical protein
MPARLQVSPAADKTFFTYLTMLGRTSTTSAFFLLYLTELHGLSRTTERAIDARYA